MIKILILNFIGIKHFFFYLLLLLHLIGFYSSNQGYKQTHGWYIVIRI